MAVWISFVDVKRVVLGILGAVLGLVGLGLLFAGGVLFSIFGSDGEADIPLGRLAAKEGRAVVVTDFEIASTTPAPLEQSWFDLQLQITGKKELFAGVASREDTLKYLQGVPYELVTTIDSSGDGLDSTTIPGDAVPSDPQAETFWTDSGAGRKVDVTWPIGTGETTLMIMNSDASSPVRADVSVVAAVSWAVPAAIGAVVAGVVLAVVALLLVVLAFRSGGKNDQWPPPAPQSGVPVG